MQKKQWTDRELLEACSYFLNMLPDERHPNNRFGLKTSYDLAHIVGLHIREPAKVMTAGTLRTIIDLYNAGYTEATILEAVNKPETAP